MCRRFLALLGTAVLLLAFLPLVSAGRPSRVLAQAQEKSARTIYVSSAYEQEGDGSRERPFRTISHALAIAQEGDRILVAGGPGITYTEILAISRPVHLQGGYNPQTWERDIQLYETVIDANAQGTAVVIGPWTTERQDILFEGFMIRNGSGLTGGGLYVYRASPNILRNRINGNWAEEAGGGIAVAEGSPLIWGNTIELNTAASGGGGGISLSHSNAILINNQVVSNYTGGTDGGGIKVDGNSQPVMSGNVIAANGARRGGGILVAGASRPRIMNSVLYLNMANEEGGGILVGDGSAEVTNATILDNIPDGIAAATTDLASAAGTAISVTNCILWGHDGHDLVGDGLNVRFSDVESGTPAGPGNISVDPLLRDIPAYDFHLRADSPLVDAGTNDIATVSVVPLETDFEDDRRFYDGNGDGFPQVDMGADEVAANLRASSKDIVSAASLPTNGGVLQYLITLHNSGQIAASRTTVTDTLPVLLALRPGSLLASTGTVSASDGRIVWQGSVSTSEAVTITFAADVSETAPPQQSVINIAQIDYGAYRLWYVPSIITIVQKRVAHLPLVLRAFSAGQIP